MSGFNRVAILGLGLMGGSLAAALKQRGQAKEIVGWGYRDKSLIIAKNKGLIDDFSLDLEQVLNGAEIAVVCSPSKVAEQLICNVVKAAKPSTVVTDVASVKSNLAARLADEFGTVPANVVLGHPIAGSERSGIDAANPDLYANHQVIITPADNAFPDAVERVTALWSSVGASVSTMSASEHDAILAGTSHLPHLLAYNMIGALAKLPTSHDVFKHAAGGLRDFTRIAASDPQMWAEIALTNKSAILDMMDMYQAEFQALKSEVDAGDETALISRFESAKKSRDYFSQLLEQRLNTGE